MVAVPSPGAIGNAAGLAALASSRATWADRLKEAAYTSPSGVRIKFEYEDVAREFDKRGRAFDFPGVDDSYVQQNGHSSRRYPLRIFFSGANHDRIATAFEAALLEPGVGKLEHPLYGTIKVVPFGTITRNDPLKTGANQSVLDVTFWTTVGAVYPNAGADPQSEILKALGDFDVQLAQQFEASVDFATKLQQTSIKGTIRKYLREVSAAMQSVADTVTSVNQEFRDVQALLNEGLDVIVGQPLLLAQQVSNLIKLPGRALAGIEARLEGYHRLADSIFASKESQPEETLSTGSALTQRTIKVSNDFQVSALFALAAVAGAVGAVAADPLGDDGTPSTAPQFTTKPQALAAAEAIAAQFEALKEWSDAGYQALEQLDGAGAAQVDTGEAYQALQQAVALTQGYLVQVSFSLVPERRIVLDRARTVIDLAAELYGAIDSRLDLLIDSNGLTGDEILELPAGRSIVYYP